MLAGILTALAAPAATVLAQAGKAQKVGGAPPLDKTLSVGSLTVTIIALLGICVIAFKNSRRIQH